MKCPHCPFSNFSSEKELSAHVLKSHKKTRSEFLRYACGRCGKKFSVHSTLKQHLQTCLAHPSHQQAPHFLSHHDDSASSSGAMHDTSMPERMDDEFMLEGMDYESTSAISIHPEADQPSCAVSSCQDEDEASQPALSAEEALQEEAAKFLTHIKENCNATQRIIDEIVIGVNNLQQRFLDVLQGKMRDLAGTSEVMSTDDTLNLFEDLKLLSLFEGVETKNQLEGYLEESAGMVKPERVVFRYQEELQNGKLVHVPVDFGYIVPFLKQLELLLCCPDVLYCVDNPRQSEEWCFSNVLDGYYYKTHPVVAMDSKALAICLYHDGIEITDLISSRQGEHSLTNFYWTLGNIYPEYRSTDRVINLLATVKTTDFKKYKYDKLLADFICGMNQLTSEEGVTLNIKGTPRTFHGLLLFVAGDYPASAAIAGFKEGVTAEKPCRNCLASNSSDYLKVSDINQFQKRNNELHMQHVLEVEEYNNLSQAEKDRRPFDPSVEYGVNGRSVLMKISHVDVTKIMAQDLMHCLHEGCLELVCRLVLKHVIVTKKKLSLDEVNSRIVEYSKYLGKDKPSTILPEHLSNGLRQSAAQRYSMAILLPFVLRQETQNRESEFAGEPEFLDCLLCLLKIANLCLAFEFHATDTDRLQKLLKSFHEKLLVLVPYVTMAKLHFLHHLVDLIVLFGSIRQLACFRFEAHHALFKRLAKIIRNFINLTYSLSTRHQAKQCRAMMEENFLYKGHQYTVKRELSGMDDSNARLVKALFPNCQKLALLSRLQIPGTTYKYKSIILVSASRSNPEFAMVQQIYRVDCKEFVLLCLKLQTIKLDDKVNAYEIAPSKSKIAVDVQKLIFPHEIISIKSDGKWYAMPLGCWRFE